MDGVDITKLTDTEVTRLLVQVAESSGLEDDMFDELAEDFAEMQRRCSYGYSKLGSQERRSRRC